MLRKCYHSALHMRHSEWVSAILEFASWHAQLNTMKTGTEVSCQTV